MKLDSWLRAHMIRTMITQFRQQSRLWASLVLLLAMLAAQPVLAEHVHFVDTSHELCDICSHQMPAAPGSEYQALEAVGSYLYVAQGAPVPRDSQPERQNARGPPATLSQH
ncbi:hypothetical protein AUP74_00657 [Microbulbifer aggregans]|uniref:Uncharacterized protein n=2 Tax=Microbulbifer aggregans TaxID=1769779 RepID=A0A1C9W4Q6_9GAMM|nr:hypothetical protein AUP74_00657 [Microbulbifer aggregans]